MKLSVLNYNIDLFNHSLDINPMIQTYRLHIHPETKNLEKVSSYEMSNTGHSFFNLRIWDRNEFK